MAPRVTIPWLALSVTLLTLLATTASGNFLRNLAGPPPNCAIENGFDYEGNDIKNVPSAQADQCCSECNKVDACRFWTWSNHQGGTCWLKSARGRVLVNANVKSAALFQGGPLLYCQNSADVDFVGNDIHNVPSANVTGCCDVCRGYLGCRAYSWSNYQNGTCWLKSSKGKAIVKPGVISSQIYPSDTAPTCAQQEGIDYPGNDIGNAPGASPDACCAKCYEMDRCRLVSWTNQNGGTCYFKNLAGKPVNKTGVVSSVKSGNPTYNCSVQTGVDYPGNDIANVPSEDPGLCCEICTERPECKAYTWSDFNGGTCWLKSSKGTAVPKAKTFSGVSPWQ